VTGEPTLLTQVTQVRGLNQESAAHLIPVRLEGVVTAFSGYKNSFFIQDSGAGISVDRTDSAQVRVGDRVEVLGTSGSGLFAPLVLASRVVVLGHAAPPLARPVTYGEMFGGAQDSQWIEVQGIVHSAKIGDLFGHEALFLNVELGGGMVKLILQDFVGIDSSRLIDATLRVRGVCSTAFNEKRQFIGIGLFVPDRRDVDVVHPANDDPFSVPSVRVGNVLQFGQEQHRLKVTGIVTYQLPGRVLYLQDGNDGIQVQTASQELVAPGKRVEALGFPVMGDYSPIIEDGVFRVVGDATPVVPMRINAQDVIAKHAEFNQVPYDQQLVRLQAEVMENRIDGDQRVWLMRQGGTTFEARLPLLSSSPALAKIGVGGVLSLTGICTVHADSDRNPVSFGILLRSENDILVIRQAPWWTLTRVLGLAGILAATIVLVVLWVVMLRHRVKQQTRIIRESEEQFRYLAQHDGLTGLLNRGSILAALEQEMKRCGRDHSALTLVLADIDHFKEINDTHGHLAGDAALQRFAAALDGSIRSYDHVGRYGGEEFLIVLTGILFPDVEDRLAELHACLTNLSVRDHGTEFEMTCSLGAIYIPADAEEMDPHLALLLTDQALYRAKQAGRNRVVFHRLKGQSALPLQPRGQTIH
jgi:diguanylate cyclase (GGDEF)-like protein